MSFITGSFGNLSGGSMPSAAALFSIIATLTTFKMMIRTAVNELIPTSWRSFIESKFHYFFSRPNDDLTIVVEEFTGVCQNEVFDAAQIYLRTKINNDTSRFKVGKSVKQKTIHVSIEKGQEIVDTFEGFDVTWRYVTIEPQKKKGYSPEKHFFEITFDKTRKDIVLQEYLPFVLAKAKEIKHGEKVVKLYTTDCPKDGDEYDGNSVWGAVNFDHPSTFETLAMEPEAKKAIMEDLDQFLRKREYYKKVGKVWKRGYLLYGPPGTGKSSLIAAMANYLKFDVYDLELTSMYRNSDLRKTLLSTSNQSILVIEDIDCNEKGLGFDYYCTKAEPNEKMHDRQTRVIKDDYSRSKLTLSCLLNLIDGLWSSIGDERIIIFTTNHKDRLDPALLRPGRMDMHIHMSYCTNGGFRSLAKNYLGLGDNDHHKLFDEIKGLIEEVQVSPAQLAEELMKSGNADVALQGVVGFLKGKKAEATQIKAEE